MNHNQDEIHNRIVKIKDEIYDLRDYINSATCQECVKAHTKIAVLELELKGLERKIKWLGGSSQ
jgi:uncharacterized coiled-coil DUF342 family protein